MTLDQKDYVNYLPEVRALVNGVVQRNMAEGELFGYPWMFHLSEAELMQKFQDMWGEMGFSSIPLGKAVGMTIKPPYLDPEFMEYAKKLPIKLKINFHEGVKYSKWIMRKAYEDVIPEDVIWRPKAPL